MLDVSYAWCLQCLMPLTLEAPHAWSWYAARLCMMCDSPLLYLGRILGRRMALLSLLSQGLHWGSWKAAIEIWSTQAQTLQPLSPRPDSSGGADGQGRDLRIRAHRHNEGLAQLQGTPARVGWTPRTCHSRAVESLPPFTSGKISKVWRLPANQSMVWRLHANESMVWQLPANECMVWRLPANESPLPPSSSSSSF